MNQKIKDFLNNAKTWKEEYELLHSIISDCGLVEDFKWMHPCYTYNKANVVLIHGFKEYCAIAFFKGALLSDSKGVLIQQTENVQSGRQIRFKSLKEIEKNESIIKAYIFEAIEIEKAGLKVELKKRDDIVACEELLNKFKEDEKFKDDYEALKTKENPSISEIVMFETITSLIYDTPEINDNMKKDMTEIMDFYKNITPHTPQNFSIDVDYEA